MGHYPLGAVIMLTDTFYLNANVPAREATRALKLSVGLAGYIYTRSPTYTHTAVTSSRAQVRLGRWEGAPGLGAGYLQVQFRKVRLV